MGMWCFLPLSVFLLLLSPRCTFGDLPPHFPRCDLGDPFLGDCMLRATEDIRPLMRQGIEEVNLPAFHPLHISSFEAAQETVALNYTSMFSNCLIAGVDNYKFHKFGYNSLMLTFNGAVDFDSVNVNCMYDVKGRVLWFPIVGNGIYTANLARSSVLFEINGELIKSNNSLYYNPTRTTVKGSIQDARMNLQGLFGGNELLGQLTNKLLNENVKTIIREAMPLVEKLVEKGVMYMIKSFTNSIPYSQLFSQEPRTVPVFYFLLK